MSKLGVRLSLDPRAPISSALNDSSKIKSTLGLLRQSPSLNGSLVYDEDSFFFLRLNLKLYLKRHPYPNYLLYMLFPLIGFSILLSTFSLFE